MKNSMLLFALSLFVGMTAASLTKAPIILSVAIIGFLLLSVLCYQNRFDKKRRFIFFMLAVVFLGMAEYCLFYTRESKFQNFTDKVVTLECVIIDAPVVKPTYTQYKVKSRFANFGDKRVKGSEILYIKAKGKTQFQYGDLIKAEGQLLDMSAKRNPGDFDFRLYYKSKGIYKTLNAQKIYIMKEKQTGAYRNALFKSKEKIRKTIYSALPKEEAAVLFGIITGDRVDMDAEMVYVYSKVGLAHILSVSGLHVSFLMLLIGFLLKPLKLDIKTESILTALFILYYILLIGAPPPALRSFIMLLVLLTGRMLKRKYDLTASISFALAFILLINPLNLHDPGVIISFGCMYCIALLFEPIDKRLQFLPKLIKNDIAVSLAVWIGTAPIIAHYFNYLSIVSIILNILAIPLSFIITLAGFIGVMVGSIFPYLSLYIFSTDYYLLKLLYFISEKAAALPMAGFYIPRLPMYLYVIYYAFVLYLAEGFGNTYYKIYKGKFLIGTSIALILGLCDYSLPTSNLQVTFLDVGQGDSALIRTPGKKAVLIDTGGMAKTPTYYYDVGGKITTPALLHQGIWKIDTIIVSHIHEDHMEGLPKVLEVYRPNNMIFPKMGEGDEYSSENYRKVLELCRKKGIKISYLQDGDRIKLDKNVYLDILAPGPKLLSGTDSDINNNSLVARLTFKQFDVLFTGDIQKEGEERLLGKNIASDILKVAHHGSPYSSIPEFVKAVEPSVSILTVGKNNFGHPAPEVIEKLEAAGSKVYRTDKNGAITLLTDGRRIRVKTMK